MTIDYNLAKRLGKREIDSREIKTPVLEIERPRENLDELHRQMLMAKRRADREIIRATIEACAGFLETWWLTRILGPSLRASADRIEGTVLDYLAGEPADKIGGDDGD